VIFSTRPEAHATMHGPYYTSKATSLHISNKSSALCGHGAADHWHRLPPLTAGRQTEM